ncbi:MAG: cytochrome b/b6 domain-containing protein [Candidatus Omnitrophica bacterium]|nr:cytochrome b/b6 domain-containing protein [Candidatus Omnitrophota bacterium]
MRLRRALPALVLLALSTGSPGVAMAQDASETMLDDATCLSCHGDASSPRFVDGAAFASSVHGALSCTGCHGDVTAVPHDVPLKPVTCSACHQLETEVYLGSDHGEAVKSGVTEAASCQSCHGSPHGIRGGRDAASPTFRANIPKTCAQCHGKTEEMAKFHLNQLAPVASYEESVHGLALARGVVNAAVCTDCHGEHSITAVKQAASKVAPAHIPETCGQCHAAERLITKYRLPGHVVETYMDSFHGLSLQLGSVTAANCASCHGTHDILPSNDPRSSVHPDNLAKTCGQCHAGVSAQVAQGQIHSGTRPGLEHRVVGWVRRFYLLLILLVIGGMVVHNLLDFLKKFRAHYARMAAIGVRPRMSLNVRIQHGVLALTFLALAYTGFALKFPQAWWAIPFVGRFDWRSIGHRAAAALFILLALYHAWYVLFTSRGRHHVRALSPRRLDLVQPFQMLAYYLGWRRERPVFARYSYIEKAEYWALVWGSIIMTITGALMTWASWTLRIFPKWFFDVVAAIHYYEAILACLAILVWHFYFVTFDPDEYPMKWTWITGLPSPADQIHREDDPHDRRPDKK